MFLEHHERPDTFERMFINVTAQTLVHNVREKLLLAGLVMWIQSVVRQVHLTDVYPGQKLSVLFYVSVVSD